MADLRQTIMHHAEEIEIYTTVWLESGQKAERAIELAKEMGVDPTVFLDGSVEDQEHQAHVVAGRYLASLCSWVASTFDEQPLEVWALFRGDVERRRAQLGWRSGDEGAPDA